MGRKEIFFYLIRMVSFTLFERWALEGFVHSNPKKIIDAELWLEKKMKDLKKKYDILDEDN